MTRGPSEARPITGSGRGPTARDPPSCVCRKFQVAGHTDDEPIRFSSFQSNWQLSTERALVVVTYLVAQGMPSSAVSAAGYGEFDPVAANDGPDNRAKNRRIEIVLQPQIDEYVAVPGAP